MGVKFRGRRSRRKSSVIVGPSGKVLLRPVMPPRPAPPPTQASGLHPWLQGVHEEIMLLPEWDRVRRVARRHSCVGTPARAEAYSRGVDAVPCVRACSSGTASTR